MLNVGRGKKFRDEATTFRFFKAYHVKFHHVPSTITAPTATHSEDEKKIQKLSFKMDYIP